MLLRTSKVVSGFGRVEFEEPVIVAELDISWIWAGDRPESQQHVMALKATAEQ